MSKQVVLIFILILALLVTTFIWYNAKREQEPLANDQAISFGTEIAELRRLKELELDTAILEDSFFQNLREPEEVPPLSGEAGRKNPFSAF